MRLGHGYIIQATVKDSDKKKYYAMGDKSMNMMFLNQDDLMSRCNMIDSWFPASAEVRCDNLETVLENSQEVKKEATRIMKMFLSTKQSIGVGECLLWHVRVKFSSLNKKTRDNLHKGGYCASWIALHNLVHWEQLVSARSISQGPGDTAYRYKKISWLLVLKVLLQIVHQLSLRVAGPDRAAAGDEDLACEVDEVTGDAGVAGTGVQKSAMAGEPCKAVNDELEQQRDASDIDVDFIDATPPRKRKMAAWRVPQSIQVKRLLLEQPVKNNICNVIEKQNEELDDLALQVLRILGHSLSNQKILLPLLQSVPVIRQDLHLYCRLGRHLTTSICSTTQRLPVLFSPLVTLQPCLPSHHISSDLYLELLVRLQPCLQFLIVWPRPLIKTVKRSLFHS